MPIASKEIPEATLGIDSGKGGGFTVIIGALIFSRAMPESLLDIYLELQKISRTTKLTVYIEWIHPAIQGVGKSSMSKLYGNYMALKAFLTALKVPYEEVRPQDWQAEFRVKKVKGEPQNKWKERLRVLCQRRYPRLKTWTATKKFQYAVCDSILIAEYGRRKSNGLLLNVKRRK